MSTIDYILAISFCLLILVVIIRIWVSKRRASSNSSPTVKETVGNKIIPKNIKSDNNKLHTKINLHDNSDVEDYEQTDEILNQDDIDPIVLIKTFSAPTKKRIEAIRVAGNQIMKEAVPALIEALYEPDESISSAAADSLGKIGDPRAIEPLMEMARRTDAQLLSEMPQNSDGNEIEKQNNTDDKPYNFKELTIFKIDQLPKEYFQSDGSPIPRNELVAKGLKDPNQQLRQMAAKAAIGMEEEEAIIAPLIDVLEDKFEVESVRFLAAEALGEMGDETAINPLLNALNDDNVAVRYSAAAALSGRSDPRVVNALINAMSDEDDFVRSSITYALGTTGNELALVALFKAVSDPSDVVRFSVAKAIGSFPSEIVMEKVENYLQSNDKKTNIGLIDVLGQIKDRQATEILRTFLQNPDSDISYKASMALMGQEDLDILDEIIEASKRVDKELIDLFNTKKTNINVDNTNNTADNSTVPNSKHSNILNTIIGDSPSLEALRQKLIDSNANIRGRAAADLGEFESERAINLLISSLKDENEYVRTASITSLGKIGQENCLSALLEMKNDPSNEVRYALVRAFSNFYDERVITCLEEIAANDTAKDVKRNAKMVIEKLKA